MHLDENPFTGQCEKEDRKAYFYWSSSKDITAVKGLNALLHPHTTLLVVMSSVGPVTDTAAPSVRVTFVSALK